MNPGDDTKCTQCYLSARHPLAQLDSSGLCGPCRREKTPEDDRTRRSELRDRMEKLFSELSADPRTRVLLAYSGGKDSAWTLLQLRRRYGLRVRALTVDNGFLSKETLRNAALVAAELGADHVVRRPEPAILQKLFRASLSQELFPATALTRASSVCNACIAVVKSLCLEEALAQEMDVVAWGWSPAQLPVTAALLQPDRSLLVEMMERLWSPIRKALGPEARYLETWRRPTEGAWRPPRLVSPLALFPYDEGRVIEELERLGWKRPQDVDPNSTNCRLNALACHAHRTRYGFHPYALEVAGLVRGKELDPIEADRRLAEGESPEELMRIARELELDESLLREFGLLETG